MKIIFESQKLIRKTLRKIGWDLHKLRVDKDQDYQIRKIIESLDVDIVFDVGANKGQFVQQLRFIGHKGKIVSFEPIEAAHQTLLIRSRTDTSWNIYPRCAIGDADGEITINISKNSVSSSILPILESHTDSSFDSYYIDSEITPIKKLDSISPELLGEDNSCFIKIDTQGYEWHVLDGAQNTLKQTKGILCELSLIPLYEGQHLWRDVIDRLESLGFVLWAIQKGFTDKDTGQTLQVNAIFIRK